MKSNECPKHCENCPLHLLSCLAVLWAGQSGLISSIPLRKHLISHYVTLTGHKWDIVPHDLACEVLRDAVHMKEKLGK